MHTDRKQGISQRLASLYHGQHDIIHTTGKALGNSQCECMKAHGVLDVHLHWETVIQIGLACSSQESAVHRHVQNASV